MTRRLLYAAMSAEARRDPSVARAEALRLLVELIKLLPNVGPVPLIVDSIPELPVSNYLEVTALGELLNRNLVDPIEVLVTSRRWRTILGLRLGPPTGESAVFEIEFYWNRRGDAMVRLEGDPGAMGTCTINAQWNAVNANGDIIDEPLSLKHAIACTTNLK